MDENWLWQLIKNPYLWCTIVVIWACWFYQRYIVPLSFFKRLGVPGPPAYPIVGSILADSAIAQEKGGQEIQRVFIKKYGKVHGIFMGPKPCYMVADPDIIQQIFIKEFSKFPNRTVFFTVPATEGGIINLKDGHWKHVRTLLNPTFTASKMKQMLPIMSDSIHILLSKMEKVADTDESIEMWQCLQQLTMEIIAASAFGTKCDAQSNSNSRIVQSASATFRLNFAVLALSIMMPMLSGLWVKLDRPFTNGIKYIDSVVRGIIKGRREEGATEAKYKDLLQLMIDASNNDNKSLSDDEIIAQSITFLLGGYETSSSCIAFTAYLLANHLEIQDKLTKEIDDVCNDHEDITYDMLNSMEYLDMVIKESLRMYPPGFILLRDTKVGFECKGYKFTESTPIFIPVYGIHHDPDVWPDPERFDPERFTKEASETRHPCAFMSFGAGPRNCIGMRFALMEIKLTLAKILHRFNFVVCPETEIPLKLAATSTLSPKNGVRLRIKSIKS